MIEQLAFVPTVDGDALDKARTPEEVEASTNFDPITGGPKFQPPLARNSDPITSHQAAADAKRNANTLRARCLAALKAHPEGLTDFELADLVGAQQTSAGKRRGELVAAGLVEKTDEKRPAPSGSLALVWRYIVR